MPKTKGKKTAWTDDILKFGMDNQFAQALQSILQQGVDIVNQQPEIVESISKFLQAGRSMTELRWKQVGQTLLEAKFQNRVIFTGYEWFTFKVPGGAYTPDFNYLLENGHWVHVEVKPGKFKQPSYRDARARLRVAASLNPWFHFIEADEDRQNPLGWKLETIQPDPQFVDALVRSL